MLSELIHLYMEHMSKLEGFYEENKWFSLIAAVSRIRPLKYVNEKCNAISLIYPSQYFCNNTSRVSINESLTFIMFLLGQQLSISTPRVYFSLKNIISKHSIKFSCNIIFFYFSRMRWTQGLSKEKMNIFDCKKYSQFQHTQGFRWQKDILFSRRYSITHSYTELIKKLFEAFRVNILST